MIIIFYKSYHIRIKLVFLFFSFLLLLVAVRVFYIQVFDYKKLSNLANDLWSRDLVIEADRGKILDRNGIVLADNLTTASIIVVPNQIKDKEMTAKKIADVLNTDYQEILKHISKNVSLERIHPEGRRLSLDIVSEIEKLKLSGVYLVKEAKRYYPYNDFLSHVLGYVGIDNQGLSGLELQYDKYLTGNNGKIKYYSDAHGNRLEASDVYIAPTAGMDVQLTIDYRIQESLEREMDNIYHMFNPDMALALVVDPKTGEILGMSSYPDYNPNEYKKYSSEVLNRNLPIWASYEPGSTFKVVTMSAAVNEGVIDIYNDHFYDTGKVNVDGSVLKCWKSVGHGDQTYLQVLQNSCNLEVDTGTINLNLLKAHFFGDPFIIFIDKNTILNYYIT